jgi:hypothetical protein
LNPVCFEVSMGQLSRLAEWIPPLLRMAISIPLSSLWN